VGLTVAIMQPYFIPYAGYFRLFTQADLFVVYDDVQFPRRGWLHRNKLIDRGGEERWLTLPLRPAPQEVLIRDLAFADNAEPELAERLRPFDLDTPQVAQAAPILERLRAPEPSPLAYIVELLELTCAALEIPCNLAMASDHAIPPHVRGQDRILALCHSLGATRYLNSPGGRDLYDEAGFADAGIELAFLDPFQGRGGSILQRLLTEPALAVRAEL